MIPVSQIKLSNLKQWGYMTGDCHRTGNMTWSRGESVTSRLSFIVNWLSSEPYLELNYVFDGKPIKYKIGFVSAPSNLGKGEVWYFLCPVTKKRCRVLYLIGGYFLHRGAFGHSMYECQTQSKSSRQITQKYKPLYHGNEYDQLRAKHFRTHYDGTFTKRFLRITKNIRKAEAMPDPLLQNRLFNV